MRALPPPPRRPFGFSCLRQGLHLPGILFALLCLLTGVASGDGAPALSRVQTIDLKAGWNAVFLEVEPLEVAPEKVFAEVPADIVAAYFPHEAPTQFVTNPGTQLFKGLGWGVWYAENRPDAFLKSLNAIYGNQAYLIHAKSDFKWQLEGLVALAKVRWQPDSYNFTGFGVKSQGAPSFAEFFAVSPAHQGQPVYRLEQSVWRKVVNPAAEAMRSGEAFWVFCKGGSDYQGPFTVETSTGSSLLELDSSDTLVLRNHANHPVTPHMEHLITKSPAVPLSINVRILGSSEDPIRYAPAVKPATAWEQAMPAMESGARLALPFTARTADMTAAEHGSLLRFTTDMGTEIWIPALSRRADLEKK